MATNIKPFVFFFLSSLLLVSAAIAFETNEQEKKDPQVELCRRQCKQQAGLDKWQKKACQEKCKQKRGGGSSIMEEWNPQSPRERLQECQQQCESREQQHRPECRKQCEDRYKQEQQQQGQDPQKQYQECKKQCQRESEEPGRRQKQEREKCEQKCEQQLEERQREGEGDRPRNPTYEGEEESQHHQQQGEEVENPYVFDEQHFSTSVKTQHGSVRVLQKFHRHSKLLRGLKNYRLVILEANPQTFILPHHCDAETVIFVAEGRGTISLVHSERRESLNLRCGDILRIPAGTTVYLINRDNNKKLVIAKLVQPISTPGSFEEFFGAGGENPESFFRAFSTELLEAAFNTKRDRLQKLLGQQKQGIIVKASEEQIRALSQHQEGGVWPFGESRGTTNLFQKRPEHSNQYGEVREVTANDYRQLEDLDVTVSFANITKGAMETPLYNSKSTKISIVLNGEGYFEMACPHLGSSSESKEEESQQGESSRPTHYQKVNGPLRQGKVLIVPAGHPIIMVASNNRNLEVLCFEVNAKNNERVPLAGRKNIWNQVEKEAKELAFGIPSREVESILQNQKQDWFFKGPSQQPQQHQGRAYE